MEKHEYKTLYDFEDCYWWYLGLKHTIMKLLSTYIGIDKISTFRILDIGCGTGGNLQFLKKFVEGIGIDYSPDALSFSKIRGLKLLCRGSVEEFPFKPDTFDLILSVDVLSHKKVKGKFKVLHNIRELLKP